MSAPALVSWIARNNDPFERERRSPELALGPDRKPVPGPTLTLLFDDDSPYQGQIKDVFLLAQIHPDSADERAAAQRVIQETTAAIAERDATVRVHTRFWKGTDPTDHRAIYDFLREHLPLIRNAVPGQELIVHASPGTGAMHTVWILLSETGMIDDPFAVVQTVPRRFRSPGDPAVLPVQIGIDTLYKTVRASRPAHPSDSEEPAFWDPSRFRSDALKRVYDEARRYAPLDVPVLILGERGTGKTTLASWIRANSPFRKPGLDDAWPSVPCGQYAPETMRAELFGYTKGSYTGADRDHDGLLHRADGDTLFLDEIGDVSSDLQRLLIRAIEDGSYTPLGSPERKTSDFRLLTATNVPVAELHGRLDPDFLDRISPLQLRVPPLRELTDDHDWIWRGVYYEAASRAGVNPDALAEESHGRVVSILQGHPLPGNVRDLYRVAYRLLAHADDVEDRLDALTTDALAGGASASETGTAEDSPVASTLRACANGTSLDSVYSQHGPIPAKATITAVKSHIAQEVRDLAKRRDLRINDVADVTDRTLLNWSDLNPQ
ncbi:sigma-54-dependent transcriptional regulator [Rubrivirga sp. IMCC43871]|uniref:sigma-54-dependent transcriptional regulator n=1 Tax=Rubrivirga sp. IMCC43871 TaxID=3391575 RepID=UPI0039903262